MDYIVVFEGVKDEIDLRNFLWDLENYLIIKLYFNLYLIIWNDVI